MLAKESVQDIDQVDIQLLFLRIAKRGHGQVLSMEVQRGSAAPILAKSGVGVNAFARNLFRLNPRFPRLDGVRAGANIGACLSRRFIARPERRANACS
jgi:hypothetical protein